MNPSPGRFAHLPLCCLFGVGIRGVVTRAADESAKAQAALLAAGTVIPDMPQPSPIDIFALDTPNTRELLAALEKALVIAERVDRSRGRVLPSHIPTTASESRGTDLAEVVARVRIEVHGATGKGLE